MPLRQYRALYYSHFHLDHCAGLPYFTERMKGFKGRIFATHSTVEVMKIILSDYIRVTNIDADKSLYSEQELLNCMDRFEKIDFKQVRREFSRAGNSLDTDVVARRDAPPPPTPLLRPQQTLTVSGIKFMLYPAGHVLGAAMVLLEIGGTRLLYTGDYSMEEDRHLMAAEAPVDAPPDVLIIESTFGVQTHKSREIREALFTGS